MSSQDSVKIDDVTIRVANVLFDYKVDGRIHRPVFINILRDRCNMDESKADQIYQQIDHRRSGVVQYEDLANFLHNHPTIREQMSEEIDHVTVSPNHSMTRLDSFERNKLQKRSWSSRNLMNVAGAGGGAQPYMFAPPQPRQQYQQQMPAMQGGGNKNDGSRMSQSPPMSSQRELQQQQQFAMMQQFGAYNSPSNTSDTQFAGGVPSGPYFTQQAMTANGTMFDSNPFINIPVGGTGGGGTIYQNPLYHGSSAYYHPAMMMTPAMMAQQQQAQAQAQQQQQQQRIAGATTAGTTPYMTIGAKTGSIDVTRHGITEDGGVDDDGDSSSSRGGGHIAGVKGDNRETEENDNVSDDGKSEMDVATSKSDGGESATETLDFETWVRYHHGATPIKKLLIANNGISAVKSVRCMRQWCYETFGDKNIIHFVCMATPEDTQSNAEYIRLADEVVPVPGGANNYNYANVSLIVSIAKQTKCDAVWPGWGHASENPALPRALKENGILWVGPDADSMYASGDKIMSTLIAQSAGVPCIPWSGDGIRCKYRKNNPTEIESKFRQACVKNAKDCLKHAKRIGFPVMIKASEGGGGKGIRMCHSEKDLESLYHQCASEVPGSPIFVMKLAKNARHLEVQLLGDHFGNCIAVFGRDCSIQRRCQKIIEEGPVVNVDPKLLLEMEGAAVALAKAVSYCNAGTVEFLYDNDEKKVYFLELNPRLQVEHPVSELVSGVNLPAAQLLVAMGIPLYCISDIRRMYGQDPRGIEPFALEPESRIEPQKHAIACRITAENPSNKFRPTSGDISELLFRSSPNVWGYFSLKQSSKIHDYADSQFGHIFAHGKTRDEARKAMVLALSELEIRGEIRTTVEFLKSVLENDEYIAGKIDTVWLERNMDTLPIMVPTHLTAEKIVLLGAIATAHRTLSKIQKNLVETLEWGRNVNRRDFEDKIVSCCAQLIYQNIKYLIWVERTSPNSYTLRQDGNDWSVDIILRELADSGLLVSLDGRTHTLYASWNSADQLNMCADGHTVVFEQEYDPSSIRAEMPGKLVRLLVPNGSHVNKHDPFAEIEVMKMYMQLVAPESGLISFTAQVGSILQIGQIIAALKLDDPSQVKTAHDYTEKFPKMNKPEADAVKIDVKIQKSLQKVEYMLDGYIAATDRDNKYVRKRIDEMMGALRDPRLPVDEFFTYLEPLRGRINESLYDKLYDIATEHRANLTLNRLPWEAPSTFPSNKIIGTIDVFRHGILTQSEKGVFDGVIAPLKEVTERHRLGTHHYAVKIVIDLLEKFLGTERQFVDRNEIIVIQNLRRETPDNLQLVCDVVRAHFQLKHREKLVMELLNIVENIFHKKMFQFISRLSPILEEMTSLNGIEYGRIHLKSRAILLSLQVPSESQRRMEIENMLSSHVSIAHASMMTSNLSSGHLKGLNRSDSSQSSSSNLSAGISPGGGGLSMTSMKSAQSTPQRRDSMMTSARHGGDYLDNKELLHQLPDILEILPQYMADPAQNISSNAVELWVRSVFSPPFYFLNKRSVEVNWEPFVSTTCAFDYATKSTNSSENDSPPNSSLQLPSNPVIGNKRGFFGYYQSIDKLKQNFDTIFSHFSRRNALPLNVIILAFPHELPFSETQFISDMERFLQHKYRSALKQCGISFLSFLVNLPEGSPPLFTFRQALDYKEDLITRHIMPPLVTMLEMDRLKNGFQIQWQPTENRRIHVFEAIPKQNYYNRSRNSVSVGSKDDNAPKRQNKNARDARRLFVRVPVSQLVKPTTMFEDVLTDYYRFGGPEFALMEVIHALESLMSTSQNRNKWQFNHILLSCFFDVDFTQESMDKSQKNKQWTKRLFQYMHNRFATNYQIFIKAFHALHITNLECRIQVRTLHRQSLEPLVIRAFVEDPGNAVVQIHLYYEKKSKEDGSIKLIDPGYGKMPGPLHGTEAYAPHCVEYPLMHQRRSAMRLGTTYVYDWPTLFEKALKSQWETFREQYGVNNNSENDGNNNNNNNGNNSEKSNKKSKDKSNVDKDVVVKSDKNENKSNDDNKTNVEKEMNNIEIASNFDEENLLKFEELVLDKHGKLTTINRTPGENRLGMVAWRVHLKTPQYPNGRYLYIVANDITCNLGTFGRIEDALYNNVCELAQKEGLPFLYMSANSGARIGMDSSTRDKFKIAWTMSDSGIAGMLHPKSLKPTKSRIKLAEDDSSVPSSEDGAISNVDELKDDSKNGNEIANVSQDSRYEPDYLYLSEKDYESLCHLVNAEKLITEEGEIRYKLIDIIGNEGIGVENLSGSGLIAGATSRAYFNTFTLSYVTGRSVGIGAYLVRLGQRIIQKTDSPILLTGYVALNNLLGRPVYISNLQIGGADEIMMPNGVSHRQVESDLQGAWEILQWLSFVPHKQGCSFPIPNVKTLHDPIDRDVEYIPDSGKYDPRCLIAGEYKALRNNDGLLYYDNYRVTSQESNASGESTSSKQNSGAAGQVDTTKDLSSYATKWQSGLFDENSFVEYLSNWAKTVVVGRARLGGIPVGVIAAEPRTQTCVIPPDPANDDSRELSFQQAGQVWYPDSSFKTAQAIKDFDNEQLPLFILANWRGFSGGQRDMFNEVLKYGSFIVDNLSNYKQPVFVYLPPTAELRGGAWVVLDKLINSKCIEMYAAKTARANVLEPTGTIGLKYRKNELLKSMHRLDYTLIQLKSQENEILHKINNGPASPSSSSSLKSQIPSVSKIKSVKTIDENKETKAVKSNVTTVGTGNGKTVTTGRTGENENEMMLSHIRKEIENRERTLLPVYQRIALMFAELHDTPGRMKAVKVINEVVKWTQSRRYFYWRLRKRLIVNESILNIVNCLSNGNEKKQFINEINDNEWNMARLKFEEWVKSNVLSENDSSQESKNDVESINDCEFVESFLGSECEFNNYLVGLKKEKLESDFKNIVREYPGDIRELKNLLMQMGSFTQPTDV